VFYLLGQRTVDAEALVRFENVRYSVPAFHAAARVAIEAFGGTIRIRTSNLSCGQRKKLIPHAHGKAAGDENGLVASTTNITRECRSVEPLLEACIGMSAP
jgi:hypothetical protein